MSDNNKPTRSVEDAHREYSQGCAQAGHLQYQISVLKADLEALNQTLRALNQEAAELKAQEGA